MKTSRILVILGAVICSLPAGLEARWATAAAGAADMYLAGKFDQINKRYYTANVGAAATTKTVQRFVDPAAGTAVGTPLVADTTFSTPATAIVNGVAAQINPIYNKQVGADGGSGVNLFSLAGTKP
ncbi:hypothetical protein KAU11_02100, partial [Candidatus Babeliales bacterium]|nr:hypothetical protein [Candidatus Babeliales bacterium]